MSAKLQQIKNLLHMPITYEELAQQRKPVKLRRQHRNIAPSSGVKAMRHALAHQVMPAHARTSA
ncbi:MAG: hypothetical protein RSB86_04620 [Comamonas sp.]|jgi:hypothetical protein|uniref:hypothetical protein n=1 Tax=Comamonas sp. TaxID=34028 RepID=UPI002FC93C10